MQYKRIGEKAKTYISLFSSAGVGCYGFKLNGFDCVATNELIERRLNIQKFNNKCSMNSGYILGDITDKHIKKQLFKQVKLYKTQNNVQDIDLIIATPPCQGMSVANHKKAENEINRNSLVVEAINIINEINPKFFIFENVQAFMKTKCFDNGTQKTISDSIKDNLSKNYIYIDKILNFKNYGSNSSRTRTIVIGVRKDLSDNILPFELFPDYKEEKTLKDLIYELPRLKKMGEISEKDIYHSFREYSPHMRKWITNIKEGQSAYDNKSPNKRPHQVINGKIIENVNKNGDKYKRQYWDKVAPCIHTRNDILASQNTIHPEDDRVFSIRELMIMMSIPDSFKWVEENETYLNSLSTKDKKIFIKKNDINIRQSIGEAVPTGVMFSIAEKIKNYLNACQIDDKEIKKIIQEKNLSDTTELINYIKNNRKKYSLNTLSRIAELANTQRAENAAFYTNKRLLFEIYKKLPDIKKDSIHIIEPAVGIGNFIPLIIDKYSNCKKLNIDIYDIDKDSLKILKALYKFFNFPHNVSISATNKDFLLTKKDKTYDLAIGNPPYKKISDKKLLSDYKKKYNDFQANNLAAFFTEKCLQIADNICLILPKYFLHNTDFETCRNFTEKYAINSIIDFGEKGFKGVLIETICIFVNKTNIPKYTECYSLTYNKTNIILQSKLTDDKFPNWLLYRNDDFDKIAKKLNFDIFECFRDRQLTNKKLKDTGKIWVIKSRNITKDGTTIEHLTKYDSFLDSIDEFKTLSVSKYYDRDDVYLSPNMTYYPRVIKKPKKTIVNGSVAIFETKTNNIISDSDLKYFSTNEFRNFYSIARNLSTRSLNLDKNAVFYFGIRRKKHVNK